MSSLTPTAAEILASVMGTAPEAESAFEANHRRPFEFRWAYSQDGLSAEYQRRELNKVTAARESRGLRGSATPKASGLAAMILPCAGCGSAHSPIHPCGL